MINSRQHHWDHHFLRMAYVQTRMSKDPKTQVGAVIVGPDGESLISGFNGFPRGIADTQERLYDRDLKLRLTVHAEMNTVLTAARVGIRLKGCSLYFVATDETREIWGGPSCVRCTVEIIQTGIVEIVSPPARRRPSRWHDDQVLSRQLLEEAGVVYREVEFGKLAQSGRTT